MQHNDQGVMNEIGSDIFRLVTAFSADQIDCICETLYQARDGQKLTEIFRPDVQNVMFYRSGYYSNSVIRAFLYVLFHNRRYEELFQAIAMNTFDQRFFGELQDLWYKARYAENEERRHKELGAVEKYRLRKKHPPPRSIWDGQETIYSFKENARKVLRQFYKRNKYPTLDDKMEIARITDLKIVQISNWFKNRRQRDKTSSDHIAVPMHLQFDASSVL